MSLVQKGYLLADHVTRVGSPRNLNTGGRSYVPADFTDPGRREANGILVVYETGYDQSFYEILSSEATYYSGYCEIVHTLLPRYTCVHLADIMMKRTIDLGNSKIGKWSHLQLQAGRSSTAIPKAFRSLADSIARKLKQIKIELDALVVSENYDGLASYQIDLPDLTEADQAKLSMVKEGGTNYDAVRSIVIRRQLRKGKLEKALKMKGVI